MKVTRAAVRPVSYEQWDNGASLIDAGYDLGVLLNNPSDLIARDVRLEGTLQTKNGEQPVAYRIDEVPPGDLAWGSLLPVSRSDDQPVIDPSQMKVTVGKWESATEPSDRLLTPSRMSAAEWKGQIHVAPADDHRVLVAMVAYLDRDARLIAVEPTRVHQQDLRANGGEAGVPALPEGGPSGIAEVRVFLTRTTHPSEVLPRPLQVTAADVTAARERWRKGGPSSYTWRFRKDCFCNGATIEVSVADGAVTATRVLDPGMGAYPPEAAQADALTIDSLFDYIEQATTRGDVVFGSFDAGLGYPRSVTITSRLPDGGDTFEITDFIQ